MGEPARDHARIAAQVRSAAHAFAAGLDAIALVPAEIREQVLEWRQELRRSGATLDLEGWLLGLLTLACLAHSDLLAPGHIRGRGFTTAAATSSTTLTDPLSNSGSPAVGPEVVVRLLASATKAPSWSWTRASCPGGHAMAQQPQVLASRLLRRDRSTPGSA